MRLPCPTGRARRRAPAGSGSDAHGRCRPPRGGSGRSAGSKGAWPWPALCADADAEADADATVISDRAAASSWGDRARGTSPWVESVDDRPQQLPGHAVRGPVGRGPEPAGPVAPEPRCRCLGPRGPEALRTKSGGRRHAPMVGTDPQPSRPPGHGRRRPSVHGRTGRRKTAGNARGAARGAPGTGSEVLRGLVGHVRPRAARSTTGWARQSTTPDRRSRTVGRSCTGWGGTTMHRQATLDPDLFLPEPDAGETWATVVSVDDHVVEPAHTFEGRLPPVWPTGPRGSSRPTRATRCGSSRVGATARSA